MSRNVARPPAPKLRKHKVTLAADGATSVLITGSFCDWGEGVPLKKGRDGTWSATLSLPPGRYEYRFLVDGEWRDDPACTWRVPNGFGTENSVLEV